MCYLIDEINCFGLQFPGMFQAELDCCDYLCFFGRGGFDLLTQ